jgi:hypothetical protein
MTTAPGEWSGYYDYTAIIHFQLHTKEPGAIPIEDRFRFVVIAMNVEVVMEAVMAIGNIIVIVFIVGIFIADQSATALACGIVIPETTAAEDQMFISLIVIPKYAFSTLVTQHGQFVQTGFTICAVVEMVGVVRLQNTAAVVAS